MQRLTYSPKVYAFVRTDDYPLGLDISDYIVRGNVHRVTNAVSTAEVELRNPDKLFTQPGQPIFHPMDPITIFLTRLKDRPVQVFTGYLDSTPYLQLFPGTVKLTASCTLKRLLHTYWDPSLPYVFNGFLREYGWNLDPKTGQMFSDNLYDGPTLDQSHRSLNDGSFGTLLYATLEHIGHWDSDSIYIEQLPPGIVEKVTSIYNKTAEENKPLASLVTDLFANLLGTSAMGGGGGPLSDTTGGDTEPGDLIGEFNGTAYGPPWNTMNGSGVTAGGTDLRDGKRHYILAADPSVLPLGTRVYVDPNPYGYKGTFLVDDTGGAINGKHIDIYVSEGRDKQLAWGGQQVKVYKAVPRKKGSKRESGAAPASTTDANTSSKTTRWDAILAEANRINKYGTMYQYGTGHATPVPKDGPWDCSSAVSALLQAAGYQVPTFATPDAPSLLHAGEGKRVTFWNNANPGAGGHIYAVIDGKRWGAESGQNSGWLTGTGPRAGYQPFTVPGGEATLDEPYDIPANAETTVPGGGDTGGTATATTGNEGTASAFAAYLNLPSVLDTAEAIGLSGQKSLLNDQPLFPFVQQLSQGALRNFQSMPNGNFYAFFPDYFGGFGHRTPYWLIRDIEIMDGGIDLTDESLATHVYIIGDINFDQRIDLMDRLQSGGVMDLESAFKSGFINGPNITHDDAKKFLQKYGARPYKEELPMIRSPFFEAFLSYQRFMQLWARQFATTFEFTFMPELYPGGIVGLEEHGIQCYVEEVLHTFDYEGGFTTEAVLSSPAAMRTQTSPGVSSGMVRAFDMSSPGDSGAGSPKQVAKTAPAAPLKQRLYAHPNRPNNRGR